jgi:hypothetical protein
MKNDEKRLIQSQGEISLRCQELIFEKTSDRIGSL